MKAIINLSLLDFPKYATEKARWNFNLLLLQEINDIEKSFEQKEDPQDLELMFNGKFTETLKILGYTSFMAFLNSREIPERCPKCGHLPKIEIDEEIETECRYWCHCDCDVAKSGYGFTIEDAILSWNLD